MAEHVSEVPVAPTGDEPGRKLRHGDPGMRLVQLGLFAAAFATFALLYAPQPLLPLLAAQFRTSPATASLAMSAATLALAVAIIPVSSLSEVLGRRQVLTSCALAAAVLGLATSVAPSFPVLLVIRVLQGFALAGVPAVAIAYLAEEVERGSLGRAIGLFIAGNSIGGLSGRIAAGTLADHGGWRIALTGVGVLSVTCAVVFALVLPRSAHFTPAPLRVRWLLGTLRQNMADTGLLRLYLISFAIMGAFVTIYNYLTFRLSGPPYRLSSTVIGLLFLAYLAGTYSSAAAGRLADRHGRYGVLAAAITITAAGALLTLSGSVALIVAGLVVLTAGFFAAHAVASGSVGAQARVAPAQASALYMCAFYAGSSVAGSAGGLFYGHGGWPLTVAFVLGLLAAAMTSALSQRRQAGTPASASGCG